MDLIYRGIAAVTRRFHPRGTEKILRLLHSPERKTGLRTVMDYDGDLKINIDTSSFLEWKTFFWGYYEPEVVQLVKGHLPPGGVFVDVGANVGLHTLVAAKIAKEVIAIEPAPELADRLQANLDLNKLANVTVLRCAASDKDGTVDFYLPEAGSSNMGLGSVYEGYAKGNKIQVKALTLDMILKGKRIDLLKIDTEGHDGKVLLGAKQTISESRPVVIFEYVKNAWSLAGVSLGSAKSLFDNYDFETVGDPDSCNIVCIPRKP